jgi:type VI secretion system ImpB/VipA family protein
VSESIQKKLTRVRPPRVQISYDVETGGAIEKKSLPLVVGIMADLAAKSDKFTIPVKDRKFVEIDRDNFNEVMASVEPRVAFPVDNRLPGGENTKLNVELRFNNISDFRPESVVKAVPVLRQLFEARQRLNDLLAKLDGNDELDRLLQDIANNDAKKTEIKAAVDGGSNG